MTIAKNSTSYPFLALSQQYAIPYGLVLAYADVHQLEQPRDTSGDATVNRAIDELTDTQKYQVRLCLRREENRQARVLGATEPHDHHLDYEGDDQ